MGMKDAQGRWLSMLGGRRYLDRSEILWQMNRDGLGAYSLGTAMRAYFIEHEMLRSLLRCLANDDGGRAPAALERLPTEIVTATALFSDGELAPAEAMTRAYLLKHGNHVEGMRLLARIGLAHDVLDDADILLEAVLELAPDYRAARYDYAIALLRRHKHAQAVAELEKLLQLDPENRVYRTSYATANVGLGEHERALALYRELLVD